MGSRSRNGVDGQQRVGFDVGGTFTDVVVEGPGGSLCIEKVLTTPDDPSLGVKRAITAALLRAGGELPSVAIAVHGTTLVANAIIERRGARTAMLTTRGFRDLLEIGGGTRYDIYDLFLPFPAPLIERRLRREVGGRIGHDGAEVEPLDRDAVRVALRELAADDAEALAVCFLHSHANDRHERAVAELAHAEHPGLQTSISCEVAGELGEHERFSTTAANAYVQPLTTDYLTELDGWLGAGRLRLMGSSGGTLSVAAARRFPITMIESGPAAGALAAADYSLRLERPHVLSFDMGGTTAKVCLIDDGRPLTSRDFEAARAERFKPGSGLALRIPVINLIEIGAGGGSRARVDDLGLLKVGPDSAGADPGPACYGRGASEPTVTDANLALGYLAPESFLGGEMALDVAAARAAIERVVAHPLGLTVTEAAWGMHELVNENMAAAVRTHVAERNRDPRRYSLVAFGGAGPAHAVAVAEKVGIGEVIVPVGAGATSALGLLIAPAAVELVRSDVCEAAAIDLDAAERAFAELEREAADALIEAGVREQDLVYERSADMRYVGQAHEIAVSLPSSRLDELGADGLLASFTATYADRYSLLNPDFGVEVSNWRLRAHARARPLERRSASRSSASTPVMEERDVYFNDAGDFVPTAVYQHDQLAPGQSFSGPAIVEQREATAVVRPRDWVTVDAELNLVVAVARTCEGRR